MFLDSFKTLAVALDVRDAYHSVFFTTPTCMAETAFKEYK